MRMGVLKIFILTCVEMVSLTVDFSCGYDIIFFFQMDFIMPRIFSDRSKVIVIGALKHSSLIGVLLQKMLRRRMSRGGKYIDVVGI